MVIALYEPLPENGCAKNNSKINANRNNRKLYNIMEGMNDIDIEINGLLKIMALFISRMDVDKCGINFNLILNYIVLTIMP